MRGRSFLAAFLFGLAPCTAVLAQSYQIITDVNSSFADGGLEYAYNGFYGPAAGVGFVASGGNTSDVTTSGLATATDTAGTATSEIMSTQATLNTLGASPVAVTATALAKADLASGSVGVAASGTYFGDSGANGGSGVAYAQVSDTLQINVAGATGSTVTQIPFTFTVDGSFNVTTADGNSNGDLQPFLYLNDGEFSEIIGSSASTNFAPVVEAPSISGWTSSGFISNTPDSIIFQGTLAVMGMQPELDVDEGLSANAGYGTGINYGDTAALSFELPAGVTYTSASGVFDSVAVPEPGAGLLVLGALAAATLRRRRRAARGL
ncbi:MAG: PEP-CTERM sorting domain-containing protein [Tepidisphaeraceae bacterium]